MNVLSERLVLPPRAPGQPVALHRALTHSGRCPTWWLLEIDSESALPSELQVGWGGAGSSAPPIRVTVPTSTRVSLWGVSLDVRVGNLAVQPNAVSVRAMPVAGPIPTTNVCEVSGEIEVDGELSKTVTIPVPRFAKAVRVDLADPTGAFIIIRADGDAVRAAWAYDKQPAAGIPLGGDSRLDVRVETATRYRALFLLHL